MRERGREGRSEKRKEVAAVGWVFLGGVLSAGRAFSGEVLSERRSFGFIRRFAPHFAQDDRAGLGP